MKPSFTKAPCLSLFLIFLAAFPTLAQEQQVEYGYGSSALISGADSLPFWFYTNTDGVVDSASANLINRFYSYYTFRDSSQSLKFSSGFDAYGRLSHKSSLFLAEIYGNLIYKGWGLKAGRFYETVGLNDDDLSMGSMMISRNATPIPKIQLSTNGFNDVPFAGEHLQFKAMIAHGWFEKRRHVENPYLHQKYFYLKVNYKIFEAMGGMVHNAIWGGEHPRYGKLPSSLGDYFRVLAGSAASQDPETPDAEIENTIGNSIGAYDFRLNVNFSQFSLKAYRLFYLEDKVSLQFRSPWDGIWGAGIDLKTDRGLVTEILWEHMNTKRQDSFDWEARGSAGYYLNSIYQSGWTYENRVIGNPLILYGRNPNFTSNYGFASNIIIAHHLGIKGRPTERFNYKILFTYSRNYGTAEDQGEPPYTPLDELRIDEYSSLIQSEFVIAPQYGLSLTTAVAFDIGHLYGRDRLGFQIGLQWDRIPLSFQD